MGKAKNVEVKEKVEVEQDVESATEEAVEETPVEVEPAKAGKDSTTFVFKNGGSRVFSKEVHGPKWKDLADEFAVTNAKVLASRDGKELA